jgi:hypothetical protein
MIMTNPCNCTQIANEGELRRRDWYKWLVFWATLLTGLLLLLSMRACNTLQPPTFQLPNRDVAAGTVAFSGTGTPGSTIELRQNDRVIGTATVDQAGKWATNIALPDSGDYTFSARTLGSNDRHSNWSGNHPVRVLPGTADTGSGTADTGSGTAWSGPPTLELPAQSPTGDTVALTGRGEPGATITILNHGIPVGSTLADANGNWSATIGGLRYVNDLEATATAANNNDLGRSGIKRLLAPGAAAALLIDQIGFGAAAPTPDGLTTGQLELAGRGEPGGSVTINFGDQALGTVPVDAEGNWRFTGPLTAASGEHDLNVEMSAGNGDRLTDNFPFAVTVPAVTAASTFDTLEEAQSGLVRLAGTADPGAQVAILVDGVEVGTTTADANGNWSYEWATPSADGGQFSFATRITDAAGNRSESDPRTLSVSPFPLSLRLIPGGSALAGGWLLRGMTAPNTPVEIIVDDEVVGTTTADADGNWSWNVPDLPGLRSFQARVDRGDNPAIITGGRVQLPADDETFSFGLQAIDPDESDPDTLRLTGFARPGSRVGIWVDGEEVDSVEADRFGRWSANLNPGKGRYTLALRNSGPDEGDLEVETVPVTLIVGDDEGESADIAITATNDAADENADIVIGGTTLPNRSVRVYINGIPTEVVTSDADGNWSVTTRKPEGRYVATAYLLDEDGEMVSSASLPGSFVVGDPPTAVQVRFGGPPAGADPAQYAANSPFLQNNPAVHIIFDASWSMRERLGTSDRVTIAREMLLEMINNDLPEGIPAALRVFGNIEGNLACRTDLMVPLGPLSRQALSDAVAAIEPQFNANTPVAASLLKVPEDMAGVDRPYVVVLLTDGAETCGGDPVAAAQSLIDQGIDVRINVVGLALGTEALRNQYRRLAEATGGSYYNANSADELRDALNRASLVPYRVIAEDGTVVATGQVNGQPVNVEPGIYTIELDGLTPLRIDDVLVTDGYVTLAAVE